MLRLLRDEPAFARLWLARALSTTGDGVTLVALMIHVARAGGGAALALVLLAEVLPTLASPLAGALADRLDRRRLLVGCELLQGALVAALALGPPRFAVLLGLVAARAALASVARPATSSAVPALVGPERREAANALLRAADEGAGIAGPALAGLLAFLGVPALFAIDAASFALAAALLLGVPRSAPAAAEGLLAASLDGLRQIARQPVARAVGGSLFVFVLFAAMENVGRPFLARDVLGGGDRGVGLLQAAPQVGLVLGFLLVARRGLGRRAGLAFAGGMALCSLGSLATGVAPSLVAAGAAQLVSGLGNGLEVAAADALLQRSVPAPLLGRAFANVYGAAHVASGLAYAAGGPLLDATAPRTLFLIVGAGGLAAAALAALLLRGR